MLTHLKNGRGDYCHFWILTYLSGDNSSKLFRCFLLFKEKEVMSQKPIVIEQLKQILTIKSDGVAIREMVRRIGISLNSVRKYLAI
jgi:hypothetical protein